MARACSGVTEVCRDRDQLAVIDDLPCLFQSAMDPKRNDAAETGLLRPGQVMLRVRRKARVVHLSHGWVTL